MLKGYLLHTKAVIHIYVYTLYVIEIGHFINSDVCLGLISHIYAIITPLFKGSFNGTYLIKHKNYLVAFFDMVHLK